MNEVVEDPNCLRNDCSERHAPHASCHVHRASSSCILSPRPKFSRIATHESPCGSLAMCKFHPRPSDRSLIHTFMQEVPDEILDLILVFAVRGHRDMRALALTCKRWRVFAIQDLAWKRLSLRGWGNRSDIVQIPIEKDLEISWYKYYEHRILSHLPNLCYLRRQQHMTVSIRSILINWLLAVIDEFQENEGMMLPQAHHQTVALFDRFCMAIPHVLQTSELQKIGAACAVLALHSGAGIDQISLACFNKASFYTDGCCTPEEIQSTCRAIRETLRFDKIPVSDTACQQIDALLTGMQKNYPSSSTYCLSHYLGELALQAEISLKYCPTTIGTSAYALACHTLGWSENIWMPIIKSKSDVSSLWQLQPCMSELQGLLRQALVMLNRRSKKSNLPHIIVKYSSRDRQHVAKVILTPSPWPMVCPHGHNRDDADYCEVCRGEMDHQDSSFQSDGIASEEMMDANLQTLDLAVETDFLPHIEAGMSTIDVETSREDVQTPVNALQNEDRGSIFQRGIVKQALPSSAQAVELLTNPSLQDVSFGAISDGNDNSFIMCPDVAFDDDQTVPANDRRASLSSVLGAVDEEEPDKCQTNCAGANVLNPHVRGGAQPCWPEDGSAMEFASSSSAHAGGHFSGKASAAAPDLARLNLV